MQFTSLSNDALLSSLRSLVGDGNRIVAQVLLYLVEVEERRLHLELAYPSMFELCIRRLGFSEGEAFRRLAAARLVNDFPQILEAIATGRVHLTNVVELRKLFTKDNVDALLAEAAGKTKRQVLEIVARIAPKPDVRPQIRRLPERVTPGSPSITEAVVAPGSPPVPVPHVEPLAPARYKVQLTASEEWCAKLERLQALTSHRHPSKDPAPVLEEAMDALLAKLEKEVLGTTDRPQKNPRPAKPEHITNAAKREVTARDGLQCSFVSQDGERCAARELLEFDHRHPRALGGTGDAANVRLLCRSHNRYAAEQLFGRAYVEERIHFRQQKDADEKRDIAQRALVGMGFKPSETERVLATIVHAQPIEHVLREALRVLTAPR